MSSKNKIAILIFIVVASLSLWLYLHNSQSTIRKELFDFEVEDTASINKIYMANMAGKQVTLEKIAPGNWEVNGKIKARPDAIKNLLITIKELRVRQPVPKNAIENISKEMAAGSTKVEIYQNNELAKVYYVGSDTQDGLGTYMLMSDPESGENSTRPFIMSIPGFNGFLSVRYFIDEETWREKTIFSFYPDQIDNINVVFSQYPDSSFTLSLSKENEISLMDSQKNNIANFDTTKAKRYITYFTNIQYEVLKNDMRKSLRDSILSNQPAHIITLQDREGKKHILKTYTKAPPVPGLIDNITRKPFTEDVERMYALINDKDIATVQYIAVGKLFHGLPYFQKHPSK